MLPHLARQIDEPIMFRIDGPHNVAHRTNGLTCDASDGYERALVEPITSNHLIANALSFCLLSRNLAEQSDAGQISPDVVVQIRGDARPYISDFKQSPKAIPVKPVNGHRY